MEVGNGGFAGFFEYAVDVLEVSAHGAWNRIVSYIATVACIDAIDQVDGKVVLIRLPVNDFMTVLLHGGDDGFDTAEDRRVREDLDLSERV